MARVKVLLATFNGIAKQREALKSLEARLADRERTLLADIGRVLSDAGYRLERVDEIRATSRTRRTGGRRKRQDLKCPKCDRRFFFAMHVARHLNAMHGRKQRDIQKVKAA